MIDPDELLRTAGDSFLAASARSAFSGLLAALERAGSEAPAGDRGRPEHEKLVAALRRVVALGPRDAISASDSRAPGPRPKPAPLSTAGVLSPPLPSNVDVLAQLEREMLTDPAVARELGPRALSSADDPKVWMKAQLRLLRLSPDLIAAWSPRWLAAAGTLVNPDEVEVLPGTIDELVFPGLGETPGLRLSPSAPWPKRLADAAAGASTADAALATAALVLWLADNDCDARHALRVVYSFGVTAVDDRYKDAIVSRVRRDVQAGRDTGVDILRRRIDLDEALHSLVFLPPPHKESWLGQKLAAARQTLWELADKLTANGHSAFLLALWDAYADVREFTAERQNFEVDFGTPGHVAASLRVYAKIDQEIHPGRVLYRRL
jgi:hypothetical protein